MKFAIVLASVFAAATAFAETKTVQFAVSTNVEVLTVKGACVQRVNSKGESKGFKLFFGTESFAQVQELYGKGFTENFIPGDAYCAEGKTGSLPLIQVAEATKSADVTSAVEAQGGFQDIRVIFYSNMDMNNAKVQAFNAL